MTVSVRLNRDLSAWLRRRSQELGVSPDRLIEDVLNHRRSAEEQGEPVPYARIAHLAGAVQGAPSDLSSNKRYLEELGGKRSA